LNPPWFWHAIHNLGDAEEDGLVIGVPTRYGGKECVTAALRSNPILTSIAIGKIIHDYGSLENFRKAGLEDGIAENRVHKEIFKEDDTETE